MSTVLTLRPEGSLLPAFPATVAPAVQAAALLILDPRRTPAKDLTSDELSEELVGLLTGVAFLLGHKNSLKDGADLVALADALAEVIKRRFAGFGLSEVGAAFRRGASGEYRQRPDEVLLPSLPCLTHWLSCYQQATRAEALQAIAQTSPPAQLPPPDPSADYPRAVAALAAHVAAHGTFPPYFDLGGCQYEWLKRLGAFRGFWSPQQYADALRKEALAELRRPAPDRSRRQQAQAVGELLRQGALPGGNAVSTTILANCKKRLFREWIRAHAARGTDLLPWLSTLAQQARPQAA